MRRIGLLVAIFKHAFEPPAWRLVRWTAGTVLALGCVLLVGLTIFVERLDRDPPTPIHADGIVALTGGAERISEAVELLANGFARRLLVTGVNQATTGSEIARLTPKFVSEFGCCIDLGYAALNTAGNALEAQRWARAHGMRSLIVVTSAYHMPRALAEIGHALPGVELVAYPVVNAKMRPHRWWHDTALVRLLAFEYAKYLIALARMNFIPDVWTGGNKMASAK
jgi:uncharacterized SAM-binding protein YcdF (DUF218 family)